MTRTARVLLALVIAGIALIGVLLSETLVLLSGWGLPDRTGPPMLVIAHRGDMEEHPEDTADAIWAAAAVGADGIEFDVHQSADGTWWVMHDATVDATTDGTGAIAQLTDQYLERLRIDAGPGFDAGPEIVRPPRLTTVLAGLATFRGEVYVDLQHAEGADVESLVGALGGAPDGSLLSVICRTETDIDAIHESGADIQAVIRLDRVEADSDADAFLVESVRELSPDRIEGLDRPVVAFTEEAFGFMSEDRLLRRSWALGVHAFLAKHLADALDARERLRTEQP